STAFYLGKEKLRHSLGRPSRSDFVQSLFIYLYSTISSNGFLGLLSGASSAKPTATIPVNQFIFFFRSHLAYIFLYFFYSQFLVS
ncbi:hypothetical protein AAAT49_15385, partial [Agathobacter rectalis]|uniref:hypothetical protein n=1 Tax=Agathobacter rectalis TaxID=39491 RepID=UPI0032C15C4E